MTQVTDKTSCETCKHWQDVPAADVGGHDVYGPWRVPGWKLCVQMSDFDHGKHAKAIGYDHLGVLTAPTFGCKLYIHKKAKKGA